MVFCNMLNHNNIKRIYRSHNPYFNRWFSAMLNVIQLLGMLILVTILILIDGFLQYEFFNGFIHAGFSHNPYFNRWFSAISCI